MKLSVHTYTNKGGRSHNEDRLKCTIGGGGGVFVLADGLGGHQKGEVASEMAARILNTRLTKLEIPDPAEMRRAFLSVNDVILEKQREPGSGRMKTTAVALRVWGDQALWGHVGDSRLYYFHAGTLDTITRDHSVTFKKFLAGEISYAALRTDEDRSSLLSVLGNPDKCLPEVTANPLTLRAGDSFLLCSDGFWEYVYDEEMLIDLLKSETPREWAEHMLLRHVRRTKPNNDNFSLITLFVGKDVVV